MNDMPPAELDIGNRAAEHEDMDTAINLLRGEMGAGFKEVNARIDTLRRETADNFRPVDADAKIEQSRKESLERLDALRADG